MRAVVIAYEDDYFDELHLLVKALRRDLGHPEMILEGRPVRGTGNFMHEAPRLLRTPLKQTKQPPDRVVCLGDADRPANLVPGAAGAPPRADRAALDRWVVGFEKTWEQHVVNEGKLTNEQSARLRVCCLRWSKESLVVSCPDALLAYAEGRRDQLEALLDACVPRPTTLDATDYLARYRNPAECMNRVIQVTRGRNYKKGRDEDDLLREQIRPSAGQRAEVLRGCPDLERLLDRIEI